MSEVALAFQCSNLNLPSAVEAVSRRLGIKLIAFGNLLRVPRDAETACRPRRTFLRSTTAHAVACENPSPTGISRNAPSRRLVDDDAAAKLPRRLPGNIDPRVVEISRCSCLRASLPFLFHLQLGTFSGLHSFKISGLSPKANVFCCLPAARITFCHHSFTQRLASAIQHKSLLSFSEVVAIETSSQWSTPRGRSTAPWLRPLLRWA